MPSKLVLLPVVSTMAYAFSSALPVASI